MTPRSTLVRQRDPRKWNERNSDRQRQKRADKEYRETQNQQQQERRKQRRAEGRVYAAGGWKAWGGTVALYKRIFTKQQGHCAICGITLRSRFEPLSEQPVGVFDHCHQEMKARGILCQGCNVALGYYEGRILLHKMAFDAYLRRFQ